MPQPIGSEGSEDDRFCLKTGTIVIALIVSTAALVLYFVFGRG